MSYATGLGPHFPWLLLESTVKVSLFIWSAFSPEAADREDGDHVLKTQPILSSTKPSLSLVMKYKNTAQITSLRAHHCQRTSSSFGSCSQQF